MPGVKLVFLLKKQIETVRFWQQRGICENAILWGNIHLILKKFEILDLSLV
jgi:hypothetical protein